MYRLYNDIPSAYNVDIKGNEITYQWYQNGRLKTRTEPIKGVGYEWLENIHPITLNPIHNNLSGLK